MTNEDIDIYSSKWNYFTRVTEVSRHVRVESCLSCCVYMFSSLLQTGVVQSSVYCISLLLSSTTTH